MNCKICGDPSSRVFRPFLEEAILLCGKDGCEEAARSQVKHPPQETVLSSFPILEVIERRFGKKAAEDYTKKHPKSRLP